MKRFFSVLIIMTLLLSVLIGCRNSNGDDQNDEQINNGNGQLGSEYPSIFDEYIYLAQNGYKLLSTGNAEFINGLILHGELLYYLYTEYVENPEPKEQSPDPESWIPFFAVIQIKGLDRSWAVMDSITINTNIPFSDISIVGFDINDNDEILLLTQDFDYDEGLNTFYYLKYSRAGELLQKEELLQTGIDWAAADVHFGNDGFIAVTGITVSGFSMQIKSVVHLWDDSLSYLREESTLWNVFAFDNEGAFLRLAENDPITLEKVDLLTGNIIEEYQLSLDYISGIFLAEENSRFDYYLVDTQFLYGFDTDVGEPELVLDFLESRIYLGQQYFLQFLADGSIAISFSVMNIQTFSLRYELTILSPVLRGELIETDEIVLAGFRLRPIFIDQVMDYNRKNPDRQIVLHDYFDYDNDWNYEGGRSRPAIERLHFDILSGKVPDIILIEELDDPDLAGLQDALVAQNYLSDLYLFIDSDPVLSRDDFFPRILKGYEDQTGRLVFINSWFAISTMITVDPSLTPENWTVDSFLTLMENNIASGMNEPLGSSVTGTDFLFQMLERMGDTFVDYDKGECFFDSYNFIRLLELTKAIPQAPPPEFWYSLNYQELYTGRQVVDLASFASMEGWVTGEHYGYAPAGFTFEFLGNPGATAAVQSARLPGTYSIFESSKNKDAAWQFIREVLLPGAEYNEFVKRLTLRIDDFEDNLASVSMTDTQRKTLRDIVNNATVHKPLSGTILMIIAEEITPFLNDTRSAADTARIIQSRVSRYISERS